MLNNCLAVVLALFFTQSVFATDRCIRAAGSNAAAGTCGVWDTAACKSVADSTLVRGDTVYIATGSYSEIVLSLTATGTPITIKPATIASHGSCTGWNDSFAGQPTIAGVHFMSNDWTIDGGSRNESNWADDSSYGFRFTQRLFSSYYDPSNGQPCVDNITIKYSSIGGPRIGNTYAANPDGIYTLGLDSVTSCDNWVIQRNLISNTDLAILAQGATNWTIEYNQLQNSWAKESIRGNDVSSGHTIRYNVSLDACQEKPGDTSSFCTAEIGIWSGSLSGSYDNISVYGNVFLTTTSEEHTSGCVAIGGGTGWAGVAASNVSIYNNTCAGIVSNVADLKINGDVAGAGGGSGNLCKNNLWYSDPGTPTCIVSGGSESNNAVTGTNIFVNYASGNLRLASNTATGATLSSPYNVDMDGTTRGVPAAWSLGAFQFTGGGGGCTPDHLSFSGQPSSTTVNSSLGTVSVGIYDSGNNLCTSATDTITIANKGGTCSGMTLGGTTSGAASSGVFTTTNLTEDVTGSCTLSATATGLTGADSNSFTISATPSTGPGGMRLLIRIR